jgi:hypothetical protein
MEFAVYAFAGVGVVATIWFVGVGLTKAFEWISAASAGPIHELEDRVSELEHRLP